jgi:hypothetical protein
MEYIRINYEKMPINKETCVNICDNLRKRVIKILYLKDDAINEKIKKNDLYSYINALIWDLYGAYKVFDNYKFLNCICELEGIKENIFDDFARKKILDLASFIMTISNK